MEFSENPKTILCIDDDRSLHLVVETILRSSFGPERVQIYTALSGEEGLDRFQKIHPDIVLCDIHLPGVDGFEVCRRMRKAHPRSAVILISAYDAENDYAIKAGEAGADSYLSKPLKKGELLFVVHFILRVAQLSQEVFEKNKQLEKALHQLKQFHQKLSGLNDELRSDKRRLSMNLQEMTELNLQLEEKNAQISSMMEEMGRRFDSTEGLLVRLIEMHQSDHRGHSERVAETAVYIGEKLNLTDDQVRNIKTAARLHELGIVALPTQEQVSEALDEKKGRRFTRHPLVGEMLLKGFPGFEGVADIIRHLHENVDGSGTPDGLYGDRIPMGSRIVSVASYFDHMKSSHPDLSPHEILEKMDDLGGTVFDEQVLGFLGDYLDAQSASHESHPLECSVFALTEGMELASDIYSQSGINLLRKGTVLNKDILSKVLKFHNVDPIVGNIKVKQPS